MLGGIHRSEMEALAALGHVELGANNPTINHRAVRQEEYGARTGKLQPNFTGQVVQSRARGCPRGFHHLPSMNTTSWGIIIIIMLILSLIFLG